MGNAKFLHYALACLMILATNLQLSAQNNAINFDGIEEVVLVGALNNFDGTANNEFAIESWFNSNQNTNDATIWSIGTESGSSLRLSYRAGLGLVIDDVDGEILVQNSDFIKINRWHHVAVVYNGTEIQLYVDGVDEGRVAKTITLDGSGMKIGESSLPSGEFWSGMIDELRIWDYAISREDLFNNLFNEILGVPSGLLHYYNFNTASDTNLFDLTGSADGTQVNIARADYVASDATKLQENASGVAVSGNWSDDGLWTLGSPIPIDNVIISEDSDITVDQDATVFGLSINTLSSLDHTGFDLTIQGDMDALGAENMFAGTTDVVNFTGHNQTINTSVDNPFPIMNILGTGVTFFANSPASYGGINISSESTVDLSSASFTLQDNADWTNNGTLFSGSTLIFEGSAHSIFDTGQIGNISITSSAVVSLLSDLDIVNSFSITTEGVLAMGVNSITVPQSWDLSGVNTITWSPGAKLTVNQDVTSFHAGPGEGTVSYPTVEIVENGTLNLFSNLFIGSGESVNINGGDLSNFFGGVIFDVDGSLNINSGTYNSGSGATVFGNNGSININGGTMILQGGEGASVIETFNAEDTYEIFLNSGSVFLDEVDISGLKGGGLNLLGGNVLSFSDVTFSQSSTALSYITVDANVLDNTAIVNPTFNAGPANNIRKLAESGNGDINVVFASGTLAGPDFHLVENGDIIWTELNVTSDYAPSYDGVTQYAELPGGLAMESSYSFETWFNKRTSANNSSIVYWDMGAGQSLSIDVDGDGQLVFSSFDGEVTTSNTILGSLPTYTWIHLAFTFDGSEFVFYLNGSEATRFSAGGIVTGSPANIYLASAAGGGQFFRGYTDDTRIWSTVRTAEQIRDNAFVDLTGTEEGLESYYPGNDPEATEIEDIVGGQNGILQNFIFGGTSTGDWIEVTDKPTGKFLALSFDGADDNILVSGVPYYNTFTLEAWVNPQDAFSTSAIASWQFDGTDYAFLGISNGQLIFETNDAAVVARVFDPIAISTFEWHHVAVVVQGSEVELFVNGFSRISASVGEPSGSSNFLIGNYINEGEPAGFFSGSIDELRLWESALNSEELRAHALSEDISTHPQIGALRFFANFDQGLIAGGNNTAFNTLPDLAGSGFTGDFSELFSLSDSPGNYITSEIYEEVEVEIVGNGQLIAKNSSNTPSQEQNTSFGFTRVGESASNELLLINTGFNSVVLDEIYSYEEQFTVTTEQNFISPGDTVVAVLDFNPTFAGTYFSNVQGSYGNPSVSENFDLNVEGFAFEDFDGPGNALSGNDLGYMEVTETPVNDFTLIDAFSFEAWVNVPAESSQTIFDNINTTGVKFGVNDGSPSLSLVTNSELGILISENAGAIADREWTHVVATYDGSGVGSGIKFYVNGQFAGQGIGEATISGDLNSAPGVAVIGNFLPDGSVDELRIWNRELTESEIAQNYLGTVDPVSSGLITYFRFDDDQFSFEAMDIVGGLTGTFVGEVAPSLDASTAPLNNSSQFDELFDKAAIWSASNSTAESANLIVADQDFLKTEEDYIFVAHDNALATDNETVNSDLTSVSPLVTDRLSRSWYLESSVKDDIVPIDQGGGELFRAGIGNEETNNITNMQVAIIEEAQNSSGRFNLLFDNQLIDPFQTYYLLSSTDGTSYEIEDYFGIDVDNDSLIFQVESTDILSKGFFTLGMSGGFPGNALAFDGVDDITFSDTEISHSEQFSYEAWVKIPADAPAGTGILTVEGEVSLIVLSVDAEGKLSAFADDGSATESIISTSVIRDDLWHHIAITRDFTNGMEIYIDGVNEGAATQQFSASSFAGSLILGYNGQEATEGILQMDELRIWNTRRTSLQIQENMETVVAPGNPDLIVYYRFDQTGENLPDLSGNFNASRLNGFESDGFSSGFVTSEAFSAEIFENALDFDGTKNANSTEGDHLSVASDPALDLASGDFTLQAWVLPRDISNETILSKGEGFDVTNNDEFIFKIENGKLGLMLSDGNTIEWQYSTLNVNLNEWSHVAAIYNTGLAAVEFYINGNFAGAETYAITPSSNDNTNPLFIGKQGSSCDCNYFDGQLNDVSIWNAALPQGEIQSGILDRVASDAVNLIALYDFNVGTPDEINTAISVVPDATANGLDADIVNFNLTGLTSNFVTSSTFEFQPSLNVQFAGEELFNGDDLDFGILLEDDSVLVDLIFWNDGFEPLTITGGINYSSSVLIQEDFTKTTLAPFEGDTVQFYYFPDRFGLIDMETLIEVPSDDPVNSIFALTESVLVYENREGPGLAISLDGISQGGVSGASTDTLDNNSFTIEYWARRADNLTEDYAFGTGPVAGSSNEMLYVGFREGDVVTLAFNNDDLDVTWADANSEWNHFAFTYDQPTKTQTIYINGINAGSRIATGDFIGSGSFYVGSASFGGNFGGELDELRVWNRALTESEIREDMVLKQDFLNSSVTEELIAYYRFDDNNGTDIYDLARDVEGNSLDLVSTALSVNSNAFIGDNSIFTYTDLLIDTDPFGENVKVDNITDPSRGVHLYNVVSEESEGFSSEIFNRVKTDVYYGVFAPGNTFDVKFGTASLTTNDSLRIVKRTNDEPADVFAVSNLFSIDYAQDSIRSTGQTSGIFSIGYINYESLPGNAGRALAFDGENDEVAIDSVPLSDYNNFTIEFWIQQSAATTGQQNIFKQSNEINNGADAEIILASVLDGNPYFFVRMTDGGPGNFIQANQSVADGEWHHVAYVRNDVNLSIYIDGALDISTDAIASGAISFPSTAETSLGGDATIDEFRLWDKAIATEDLRRYIFSNEIADHPDLSGLQAYYRFDESTIATYLIDLAGNNRGELTNMDPATDRLVSGAFAVPVNTVVSLADGGAGSLREVLAQANLTPEMDTIRFNLPGEGPWEINVLSQIDMTDSVYLDATSQPGWDFSTGNMISLNGTGNSGGVGIYNTSDYVEVYGLKFENFSANALWLENDLMFRSKIGEVGKENVFINNNSALHIIGPDSTLFRNNHIGVDWDGTAGPNSSGIFIGGDADKNIVGGELAFANVIANNATGVQVNDATSSGNLIRQNEFFCNTVNGIVFDLGGNGDIASPVITVASTTEVSGTGIDGQEIDVYLAIDACDSDQGNGYLGTATVSGGVWTLGSLTLTETEFVTATANTIAEGTSPFATRFQIGDAPAVPTVESILTASLEPVITGTFEDGTDLTVEVDGIVYTLGTDAELTNPITQEWQLDLSGAPLSATGTYDIIVISTKTDIGLSSTDETTDELNIVGAPIANAASPVGDLSFTANWTEVVGITEYSLDVSTDDQFSAFIPGFEKLTISGQTDATVTGLEYGTEYFYRVRAIAAVGDTTSYSNFISVITEVGTGTVADSTALMAIYNAMGGINWTENTNWGQTGQRIETWSGITVTDGRVTAIDLQNNNVTGIMPSISGEQLSELQTLLLNDNDITTLSDLSGLTQLTDVQVQNNQLVFQSLEPNAGISGLVYSPQQTLFEPVTQEANVGTDVSIDRTLLSAANVYTWFRNGVEIPGETGPVLDLTNVSLADAGEYIARITNPNLPLLTLETEVFLLMVSSNTSDSTALVNLYNSLDGANWINNDNWLVQGQSIDTWFGVTLTNGRVTSIDLQSNNLSGIMTDITGDQLSALTTLLLSDNGISALSDLSGLTQLTTLDVSNNELIFSSLEANAGIPGFIYSPQATVFEPFSVLAPEGDDIVINRELVSANNVYSWFKDGVEIADETQPVLTLNAVSFDDEGVYVARITNPLLPELTIEAEPFTLTVSSLQRDQLALRALYSEMNGESWSGVNNWLELPIQDWSNVTIEGNRVTTINLSGVGLTGRLSSQVLQVLSLTSLDISGNDLDSLPDLTSLSLQNLNLDGNQLGFEDLIPNQNITGITIGTQRIAGGDLPDVYRDNGTDFELSVEGGHEGNTYQWFLDGTVIPQATSPTYIITDIGREEMGEYSIEISNEQLPGLIISTTVQSVFAKAKISGTASISETEVLSAGRARLLEVVDGAYEQVAEMTLGADGTFLFDTTLADYVILIDPTDLESFIPTYHVSTIQWDEASVLALNTDTTSINVSVIAKPGDPSGGDGTFVGDVFTDFPEDGRIEARRRVRRVGVALRRRRSSGRQLEDEFDLFAYTETDEEGKFSFGNLPAGVYRIYIEFPGIPIREDSFTEFEITADGKNNDVKIVATVFEDGIEINGGITGIASDLLGQLSIYPNPMTGEELHLKTDAGKAYDIRFELIDLRGKVVISAEIDRFSGQGEAARIRMTNLESGVYLYRVSIPELNGEVFKTGKLIVK